jgi:hypothetical protein
VNSQPATLHKYLYAHADPVNGIDPSGRMTLTESIAAVGIITVLSAMLSVSHLVHIEDRQYGSALSLSEESRILESIAYIEARGFLNAAGGMRFYVEEGLVRSATLGETRGNEAFVDAGSLGNLANRSVIYISKPAFSKNKKELANLLAEEYFHSQIQASGLGPYIYNFGTAMFANAIWINFYKRQDESEIDFYYYDPREHDAKEFADLVAPIK